MIRWIITFFKKVKFRFFGGYDSEKYWEQRHKQFGFDIRGVGNKGLSVEKNCEQYNQAGKVFTELCKSEGLDFSKSSVLDIGCGIGFYADLFKKGGCKSYRGIDITDQLFAELRIKYPEYEFTKEDITEQQPCNKYDLISMIDVTQHITEEQKFKRAMTHIKAAMAENAVFIVTSWLDAHRINSFYEKSRSIENYKECFSGYRFTEPQIFRDKFIFSISQKFQ